MEFKQNKNNIYKLLNEIKLLICKEEKKKIFEKNMIQLKELLKKIHEDIQNFKNWEQIQDNSTQISKSLYKMINIYKDEINLKEVKIYNVKIIQSLIQMNVIFNYVFHNKMLNFLISLINHHLKEKKNGNKIIINYYDLVEKEIYLDLELMVKEIVLYIFRSIFNENIRIKEAYFRKKKIQTTKDIIVDKEIEELLNENIIYSNLFYLEYKNRNILQSFNKTGKEIGLKDDEIIFLKINKDILDLIQNELSFITLIKTNFNQNFYFPLYECDGKEEIKKKLENIIPISFYVGTYFPRNYCIIYLKIKGVCGTGPAKDFVNVEKGIVKELYLGKDAPEWRIVKIGLNILGQCNNKECEAFKKEVIFSTYLPKKGLIFNLNKEATNINCPICKKVIRPKTCGFWKCEYQFEGQKIEEGEVKSFNSEPKETFEDKFEYFDPFENGEVQWLELNIYVLPKQKIKYIKNI